MALSKSTLLIRDYENIRRILRDIYIFGCFSKEDYIEKNDISGRKYDKEQQRINAYLPKGFIQKRRVNKKVLLYCSYDMLSGSENHLTETYRNKSFTALDIMAYFFVQQILNDNGELTASEILDNLPIINDEIDFTKDNLRVKLEELIDKGLIYSRKDGRNVYYGLSDDILVDFDDEELISLYTYLEFIMNVSPIEMPYYFLHKKLKMYMQLERKISFDDIDVFQFKHNHIFASLDNDVLLTILRAQNNHNVLKIESYNANNPPAIVIPGEIIHDSTYGRQYLYCFNLENKKPMVIRLDSINVISIEREFTDSETEIYMSMSNYSDGCWSTSGVSKELTEVVIEFRFDEDKEKYIYRRIEEEGHNGCIKKISEGVYEYRLMVRDPGEMIPWIRSFGERAKVISSGDFNIESAIAMDWEKAVKKYESI